MMILFVSSWASLYFNLTSVLHPFTSGYKRAHASSYILREVSQLQVNASEMRCVACAPVTTAAG
jgi:hypothetical protein